MGSMLDACAAGHGGVALVSGAVASGKTALLRAFGEHAAATGALFLQATGAGAERDLPLGVMGQLLLGADLPGADAELATRLLDLVAAIPPAPGADTAIPVEVAVNVLPRLCGILLAQARKRPVVLSIDDVHHADDHSLECVLYLARRLEVSRIMVVLSESSGLPSENPRFRAELLRQPGCRHIRLGPISWHGVTEMVAAGQEGRRSRPPVSDFHRLSGGSPLLMRALLEDYDALGKARSAELVPGEAFEQAVTTCLYRGDALMRRTAWALAVLGPGASHAVLADVLGTTHVPAGRSLNALNEMGLLSSGWFRHEVGRAAALQSMEPPHRARLEARVAQVLHDHGETPTVVARHLIVAEPIDAPWALPTLLEAAERALADDEVGLALDCLRAARDTCSDERQTLAIRTAMIRAGWRVNPSAAARHLPELTAAALAGRLGARDTRALIGYLLWFGQVDQALDVLDAAGERRAESATAEAGASQRFDFVRLWMGYGYPGLPGPARSDVLRVPRQTLTPAQSAQQRAVTLLSTVLDQGAGEDTVVRAEQILQGTRLDDRALTAVFAALVSLVFADALDKAVSWCDILLKEATQRGALMWQALFASAKALIEIRLGGLAEAEESACTALTLVSPEGWGVAVASPLAVLLYVKAVTGRLDEAAAQLSIPVPDAAFHTPGGLLYLWARGHYYLAAGRPYAALDDFHACGDLMTTWDLDLPAFVPWRTDAAQVYLSLGDDRRARALVAAQLARVGTESSWTRGVSLRVLAASVEPGHRPRLLGEAVEILREGGYRLELARAMDDLARAHRELGDEGRARALARSAQQLMRECGVEPPAQDAGSSRPPGRPWPPPTLREPVGLSDAELRVATLAARGHTNRQVADKLFITVSTVEQHLTRVYRKLDVRRRTDLAPKLRLYGAGPVRSEGFDDGAARARRPAV